MGIIRASSLGDFTRGGQTTLHFLRMIGQVVTKFGKFIVLCWLVFFLIYFFLNTTSYERYVGYKWLITKAGVELAKSGDTTVPFDLPDGRTVKVRMDKILADKYINTTMRRHLRVAAEAVAWGMVAIGFVFFIVVWFISRTGASMRKDKFLRGGQIADAGELAAQLKRERKASDLSIAKVPLLADSETSHILITGSPGSGKSLAIRDLLDVIRKRGDRAIVYSTAGEFIENYYRDGKDVILNPLDERCPAWHIWAEGHTPPDFDNIAASLIPEAQGNQDPFWNMAARTLFSTLAMRMKRSGNYSTANLLRDLLTIKLDEAAELVKGTEAAAIIAEGAEKTALSVRSTLAAYIRSIKFLKSEGEVFSIRDWVRSNDDDSWVFIASRPDQKETLRPLITLWLDIATSSILSLQPDLGRRIWIIIDELPSLNKLPSLPELLAQGRKYGGCCVIGFQSYAQLSDIYSQKGAEALTGLCSTWVLYRANEPMTAEWSSKSLGNVENMEGNEGLSYGANEIRDGVSLSMARHLRPLVLPTEMLNLADRHGYIRLPGDWPIGQFEIPYKKRKQVADAFIEGDLSRTSWDFSDGADDSVGSKDESSNSEVEGDSPSQEDTVPSADSDDSTANTEAKTDKKQEAPKESDLFDSVDI